MSDQPAVGVIVRVEFSRDQPIVAVFGDVDLVTASTLAGVLNGLFDDGHHQIVVDLAGLRFIDARGLSVLAASARRNINAGGSLTIRSLPAFTRRIIEATQLADLLVSESSGSLAGAHELVGAATAGRPQLYWRSSTTLTDAALRLVSSLADVTIDNAEGVSVTLERYGQLTTVAASDDAVLTMDRHQYETGEGPCLDAATKGRKFYIASLAREPRWSRFVPLALDQGIHSILSVPVLTHDRPRGALNMYSSSEQAFGADAQQLAGSFAAQASELLTMADGGVADEELSNRLATSLTARRTIHQAQGVIMARQHLTADEAIGSMFQEARAAGLTVLAYAIHLVAALESGEDGPRAT